MLSRRVMQSILGAIWFLDGLFQLKPQMFTSAFLTDVILPTSEGEPGWIASLVRWGSHVVIGHIAAWNLAFALIQLLLGLAFMLNVRIKQTIVLSIVWSAIVWSFGEGFGDVLSGQALLLTGAPGAALLYALMGLSVWPDSQSGGWSTWGVRFAQVSLAILWGAGAVLHFQYPYLTPNGLSQVISVSWLSTMIGNGGAVASVVLGLIELGLALMLMFKFKRRIALWVSVLLSVLFWWVGQSFGQVTEPLATDINSAPLIALLSICACQGVLNWRGIRHSQHTLS